MQYLHSLLYGNSLLPTKEQDSLRVYFDPECHRVSDYREVCACFQPASAEMLADLLTQHWPRLTPGPDPELEAAAEAQYHTRVREFAWQFAALCRSVVEPVSRE